MIQTDNYEIRRFIHSRNIWSTGSLNHISLGVYDKAQGYPYHIEFLKWAHSIITITSSSLLLSSPSSPSSSSSSSSLWSASSRSNDLDRFARHSHAGEYQTGCDLSSSVAKLLFKPPSSAHAGSFPYPPPSPTKLCKFIAIVFFISSASGDLRPCISLARYILKPSRDRCASVHRLYMLLNRTLFSTVFRN